MPEIDVKLSQITPSGVAASTATQIVGVQGGTGDLLFTLQQLQGGPFFSTISTGVPGTISRANPDRWSDVINVVDFGADPTGGGDSTSAIQAAVNAYHTAPNSSRGKITLPPGNYKVSGTINLPNAVTGITGVPSIVIEGSGVVGSSTIFASPAFNGFIFDDASTTLKNNLQPTSVWEVGGIAFQNAYIPSTIYKGVGAGILVAAPWVFGATSIIVTSSSLPASGIQEGAILFSGKNTSTFKSGGVPGYIGVVAPAGVAADTPIAGQTTLTLNSPGAAIPSFGVTLATGESITAVQGYYCNGAFTTTSGSVTMAQSVPTGAQALAAGYYYLWDWSLVTQNLLPIPPCLGVVQLPSGWVGNTITLNAAPGSTSNVSSAGRTNDLLILTPISGCIRHFAGSPATIRNCVFSGIFGAILDIAQISPADNGNVNPYPFHVAVRDCKCTNGVGDGNSWAIGTHGVVIGQGGIIENVDMDGIWVGARLFSFNPMLMAGRQEVCCYGIVLGGICTNGGGPGVAVSNANCTGFSIISTESEGSWGADILGLNCGTGLISGTYNSANHDNQCYGLYLLNSAGITVTGCYFAGSTTSAYGGYWNPSLRGRGQPAGIFVGNTNNPPSLLSNTFISCVSFNQAGAFAIARGYQAPAWNIPVANVGTLLTNPAMVVCINCNNPPLIYAFAALPSSFTITGTIDNTAAGAGTTLTATGGSFGGKSTLIGSAVTGAGVTAGTFISANTINAIGQKASVNILQGPIAATSLTIYPMVDGDEYMISDGRKAVGVPLTGADFGSPVIGGGTQHCKVRWNAQTLAWTLCGL